ncbi:MAG TPA: type II secretion system protein [Nitrospirota bacterium]|nr:type II secretion system protein [Nitrospirota bacterium]
MKRGCSTYKVRHAGPSRPRNRGPALRCARGFTYIALLAAIVIIGIVLGSATKYWSSISYRDKEEELLFRGNQYRVAIARYYALGGRNQYPQSIDELLKDPRTVDGKRYLRQKYKDPITGEDFAEMREQSSKRLVGVYSKSDKTPLKQTNFPDEDSDFEGKQKYSDWKFLYVLSQPGQPVQTVTPVQSVH